MHDDYYSTKIKNIEKILIHMENKYSAFKNGQYKNKSNFKRTARLQGKVGRKNEKFKIQKHEIRSTLAFLRIKI